MSSAFNSGAINAFIYDTLKELHGEKEYLKVRSRLEAIFLSTFIIASYFGPYTFSFNIRLPYILSAIFAFLWSIVTLSLFEPKITRKEHNAIRSHYLQMKKGLLFTLKHNRIIWLIMFSSLGYIILQVIDGLVTAPWIIEIGFTLKQFAVISLISAIIQTISVLFVNNIEKTLGEKRSFIAIVIGFFITLLLIYSIKNYLIAIALGILWSIVTFKQLVIENYINHHLEKGLRATVLSIHSMGLSVIGILVLAIFGFVIDSTSLSFAIFLLAIVILVIGSVLLFVRYSKRIWKTLD